MAPRFFEQPTCHWRPLVTGGVLADESGDLLRGFFRTRRPRTARGGVISALRSKKVGRRALTRKGCLPTSLLALGQGDC